MTQGTQGFSFAPGERGGGILHKGPSDPPQQHALAYERGGGCHECSDKYNVNAHGRLENGGACQEI